MKKLLLFLFLTCTTLNVQAKWVLAASVDDARFYVEINSIKQKGNLVTYWELLDYRTSQISNNINYNSAKQKIETNCNTEETAILYLVLYSENMGLGKSVYSAKFQQKDFEPNIPDTSGHAIHEFVCSKKIIK
jgi:hypothetical protein